MSEPTDDERKAEMCTRIATQTAALAERLAPRIGGTCTVSPFLGLPPCGYPEITSITCQVGESKANVVIFWSDGATARTLRARAGLRGARGWEGSLESVDPSPEPIAAAVATALRTLTLDNLVIGRRYRVHRRKGAFKPGTIVTYAGLHTPDRGEGDDSFDFTWPNGAVGGVGYGTEIDRFLEVVPD